MNGRHQPLAIAQLEEMIERGCTSPDCNHKHHDDDLVLSQVCHPRTGTDAHYTKGSGIVTIRCRTCNEIVLEIAVALTPVNHLP